MLVLFALTRVLSVITIDSSSILLLSLVVSMSNTLPLQLPSLVYLILSIRMPRLREILEGDTLGLMILVKKSKFSVDVSSEVAHMFQNQAFGNSFVGLFEWCFKPRGFISVRVQMKESDRTILIVNTHLNVGLGNSKRLSQIKELKDEIHKLSQYKDLPVILLGDTIVITKICFSITCMK